MNKDLEALDEYENDAPVDTEQQSDNIDALVDGPLIAAGQALQEMRASAGWSLLSRFIEEQIASHKDKLVSETDFREFRRVQEYIKALQNILVFPDIMISEASKHSEQVAQIKQDLE